MEDRVNYTVVGIFVVILSAALIIIGYWLSSDHKGRDYTNYVIYMKEQVGGLNIMGPVKYNGVVVGFVRNIHLDKDNPQLVRLVVRIEKDTPVTESTVATLRSQGITGITYVGLKSTTSMAPRLTAKPDEPYPVIPSEPSFLVYVSDAVRSATDNLTKITDRFEELFNEESMKDLKDTFRHVEEITGTIANNSKEIDASIKSAARILHNTSVASEHFPSVVEKLQDTLTSVKNMTTQLKNAGKKVGLTMSDSRVAIQNFSQQALPQAVRMIDHLERVAQNLEQVTAQMQQNPSVLLRGKQPSPPGPGER